MSPCATSSATDRCSTPAGTTKRGTPPGTERVRRRVTFVLGEVEPHIAARDEHVRRHLRFEAMLADLAAPETRVPLDRAVDVP
jgi:hypothetical protein